MLLGISFLQEAAQLSEISSEDLSKTYDAIFYAFGDAANPDDNDFLARCLKDVEECKDKMIAVSNSLEELHGRTKKLLQFYPKKLPFPHRRYINYEIEAECEKRDLRKAVLQSKCAYEELKEIYEMVLYSLGSTRNRDDNELLYRCLKTIESCKEKLLVVSNSVSEINERMEQYELEALYAPPPFFESR